MRNLRLELCYDGTRYRGWQRLSNSDATIQGKLEQALSRILEQPIEISGSGRTDAGVHAKGQVANFHCNSQMSSCSSFAGIYRRISAYIRVRMFPKDSMLDSMLRKRPTVTGFGTAQILVYLNGGM